MQNKSEKLLEALRKNGILKTSEVLELGISREYLRLMASKGQVIRITRGHYCLPDYAFSATQSIAEISKQIPKGVICLLSALRIHGLTTQNPFEVWIAIERGAWKPRSNRTTQTRYMMFSGKSFSEGIEIKVVDNVKVKVYNPAKTVVDCFKYRNKIGIDVAIEALKHAWNDKMFNMDELWSYSRICRVSKVMQPYIDNLLY